MRSLKNILNLSYYRKKDRARFLKILDERNCIYDILKEWHEAFNKTKQDLTAVGLVVKDYVVDLEELIRFYQGEGLRYEGAARLRFVAKGK